MRLVAMQTCPELKKAPMATCGATLAMSTSGRTMQGSLPPLILESDGGVQELRMTVRAYISSVTRFSVLAAAAIIFFPVAMEPVKLIFAISG